MDLNNLTTNDQKELLLLHILKSNLEIVENTHSKAQETLEFKMNTPTKDFQFDEPLLLSGNYMMGVTNLEVYNTVYNIDHHNNRFTILINELQRSKRSDHKIEFDIEYFPNEETFRIKNSEGEIIDINYFGHEDKKNIIQQVEEMKKEYKQEKLMELHYKIIEEQERIIKKIKQKELIEDQRLTKNEIIIPPGVYEFEELNKIIQQLIQTINKNLNVNPIEIKIESNTINMHCLLKTNYAIEFNSKFNEVLGFSKKIYYPGEHISEKVINILPINKIHLKCNCIDGSIVNGIKTTNSV